MPRGISLLACSDHHRGSRRARGRRDRQPARQQRPGPAVHNLFGIPACWVVTVFWGFQPSELRGPDGKRVSRTGVRLGFHGTDGSQRPKLWGCRLIQRFLFPSCLIQAAPDRAP